jgi:AraC-like DNA-binding protein
VLESDGYGRRFGKRLNLESAPGFLRQTLKKTLVAVTEVRSDDPEHRLSTPAADEDAYSVGLQLRDFPKHESWLDGKSIPTTALPAGLTCLYDLRSRYSWHINNPFHSIHFYFPRRAFDMICDDDELPRLSDLKFVPGVGIDDPIMRHLTMAIAPALRRPEEASQLFVEHIISAVGAHVAETYGGIRVFRQPPQGGLAPWQERRAKEILSSRLDGDLSPSAIASELGLSASHFSRAFRRSTGTTPHQWLLSRRVDEAKQLLVDRRRSLGEIAVACGFADQSHFTRVFSRLAGTSPGAWRRMQRG